MTFYSLAFKNMLRNFKNYKLYLLSSVFSIMIYYIFSSIKYNAAVMFAADAITKFDIILSLSSVVILIFAMVFIWYSNSFFVRKRKKEIGLYAMMGISKKTIGLMLFVENMLVTVMALLMGIGLGIVFSKLAFMILLKMMMINVNIGFMIPIAAVTNTVLAFFVIFFIASIHSYMIIYRFRLIELFSAAKKYEGRPKASVITALLSLCMIGFGYYLSQNLFNTNMLLGSLLVLITVIMGTFGLFSSVMVFLLRALKRNKRRYYKGTNLVATSNLVYRIRTHARTLALIAILGATTLTALGFVSVFYYDYYKNFENQFPYSYVLDYNQNTGSESQPVVVVTKDFNESGLETNGTDASEDMHVVIAGIDEVFTQLIENNPEHDMIGMSHADYLDVKGSFLNADLTVNKTADLISGGNFTLISDSNYNSLMALRDAGHEPLQLASEELVMVSLMNEFAISESVEHYKVGLEIGENMVYFDPIASHDTVVVDNYEGFVFVVNDETFNYFLSVYGPSSLHIKGVAQVSNAMNSAGLDDEVMAFADEQNILVRSFYDNFRNASEFNGLVLFSGLFMGLVFMMSTGSIIYFKMITEAEEDKDKYVILRKIGMTKKEIRKSISKQILVVFMLPLMLAISHSLFAVKAVSAFFSGSLWVPFSVTTLIYLGIYMVFYKMTVSYYVKIVS